MWKWLRTLWIREPKVRLSIEGVELDMALDVVRSLEPSMVDGVDVLTRPSPTGDERTTRVSGARLMLGREAIGLPTDSLQEIRRRMGRVLGRPRHTPSLPGCGSLVWAFRQGGLVCELKVTDETGPSVLHHDWTRCFPGTQVIGPSRGELCFSLSIDIDWRTSVDGWSHHFPRTFGKPRLYGDDAVIRDWSVNGIRPGMNRDQVPGTRKGVEFWVDGDTVSEVTGTELVCDGEVAIRVGDDRASVEAVFPVDRGGGPDSLFCRLSVGVDRDSRTWVMLLVQFVEHRVQRVEMLPLPESNFDTAHVSVIRM